MISRLTAAGTGTILALSATLLAVPAQAAPGDTNGPLLVRTAGYKSELRQLGGALVSTVTSSFGDTTEAGKFSPAGDRIAYVRTECPNECISSIVVRRNTGEVLEFEALASNIEAVTWAPDGQQLAFLASETFNDSTIYRMSLDGSEPVALVSDTDAFDVQDHGEISWNPAGGSILFVGGEAEPGGGFFNAVHASQLYTVSTSGGAPQRFNTHYPEECDYSEAEQICFHRFDSPEWSPDGGSAVVEVVENTMTAGNSSDDRYLGTITPGSADPTKIAELREPELGFSSFRGPSWSPDGTQLLFQDDDGADLYTATVNVGGGGRTRLPETLTWLFDWQPCPNGTCAVWGSEVERLPTSLTVNIATGDGKVRVNGQVTPNKAGQQVTLVLKQWARGRWVKVATKGQTLSQKSRYVVNFPRPRKDECLVIGKYAGDDTHLPVSRKVQFYC